MAIGYVVWVNLIQRAEPHLARAEIGIDEHSICEDDPHAHSPDSRGVALQVVYLKGKL
jgi:hypothetical protein